MRRFHINLRRVCVILVGIVFYVSGMFKLMDPVGSGLIVSEYLKFFHLPWLLPAARAAAVGLALLESLCGVAMVSGVFRRILSYIVLPMVGAFTLITLVLLIFNPPMDCGCFGEAIHLSHVQSFVKNLILLALSVLGFVPVRSGQRPRRAKFVIAGLAALAVFAFAGRGLIGLPMVDFTEYSIGSEDYSLAFTDADGAYADSLAADGNVLVVSVYDPSGWSWQAWERVSLLLSDAVSSGMEPILLTTDMSAVPDDLVDYAYMSDYKQLITLNRSNGGATYVSDGMVVGKWAFRDMPSSERLETLAQGSPIESAVGSVMRGRITLEVFLIGGVISMLLL